MQMHTRDLCLRLFGHGFLATSTQWHWAGSDRLAWLIRSGLLISTDKALKSWSQKFIDIIQLQLAVAKEVMFQLEHAQDHRPLSQEEVTLRHELKFKCLSWPFWHALLPVIVPV
jgi:hypothetical protein